jgi:hypothetical protein
MWGGNRTIKVNCQQVGTMLLDFAQGASSLIVFEDKHYFRMNGK